jgi:hypothetical protein
MVFGKKPSKLGIKRPHKKPKVEDDATVTVATDDVTVTGPDYNDRSDSEDDEDHEYFEFNETPADENFDFMIERSEPLLGDDVVRLAVAFLFVTHHDALEDRNLWSGKYGIRKNIRDRLGLQCQTKIDPILNDVLACKKAGISYTGERHVGDAKVGRPPILAVDSVEAQIIADSLESGGSIPIACWLANQHRKEIGAESICIAPVRSLVKRMAPSVEKIKKRAQGSALSTSVQAKAKLGWNTQLLARW